MPVIFTTTEEFDIWLSGDGEEALNRHSPDGWSNQPPAEIPGWLIVTAWFSGIAIFGAIRLAGALAKFIMPGRDPGGIIVTILIGIAGALIGGYISTRMGYGAADGIDLRSILIAVGGAIILLFFFRLIRRGA
jgi:uncharacterized membrane protein YeaQ/YmgE (transglycosylase-associated protein family)